MTHWTFSASPHISICVREIWMSRVYRWCILYDMQSFSLKEAIVIQRNLFYFLHISFGNVSTDDERKVYSFRVKRHSLSWAYYTWSPSIENARNGTMRMNEEHTICFHTFSVRNFFHTRRNEKSENWERKKN